MLKISITETRTQRRLILEGRLIAPWVAELREAGAKVKTRLGGRDLVIDLENITTISQEGENALLQLINDGAKFRCRGVLTKYVLQQLAWRAKRHPNELFDVTRPSVAEEKGQK